MFLFISDRGRLVEAHHDHRESPRLRGLSIHEAFIAALMVAREMLAEERETLLGAARAYGRDLSETDAARAEAERQSLLGVETWRWVRRAVEGALLFPPPGAMPDAHEMARRDKLYQRLFTVNGTDFGRMSIDVRRETLQTTIHALETPDVMALLVSLQGREAVELLKDAHAQLAQAIDEVAREVKEDGAARTALALARAAFDRAHATHTAAVLLCLTAAGQRADAGQYVLARNPTYRANRRAGKLVVTGDTDGLEPDVLVDPVVEPVEV